MEQKEACMFFHDWSIHLVGVGYPLDLGHDIPLTMTTRAKFLELIPLPYRNNHFFKYLLNVYTIISAQVFNYPPQYSISLLHKFIDILLSQYSKKFTSRPWIHIFFVTFVFYFICFIWIWCYYIFNIQQINVLFST